MDPKNATQDIEKEEIKNIANVNRYGEFLKTPIPNASPMNGKIIAGIQE